MVHAVANAVGGPVLDDASRSWVAGMQASGAEHDRCVADLHELLLRVARHEATRRASALQVSGPELDDIVHQAGDDALMAIKAKLADFRGESRFTTWAYGFVVFEVSTKLGRHVWRRRTEALDAEAWDRMPDLLAVSPPAHSVHRELVETLRTAIAEELTERQRAVFIAIALNQVPMDAFGREMGCNRNAIYKTLFDARRKLRAALVASGHLQPVVDSSVVVNEERIIFELVDGEAIDAGCAAGFQVLHRYVESGLRGGEPERDYLGLAAHLGACPACRDDYLGLVDAATLFGDARPSRPS